MSVTSDLSALLARQQNAFKKYGIPDMQARTDRLNRAITMLVDNRNNLRDAMQKDYYGYECPDSVLFDADGAVKSLEYAQKNLAHWMRIEERKPDSSLNLFGNKSQIYFQPKGVVGVVASKNLPIFTSMSPLAGIFAAGNSCVINLFDDTPSTSQLLERLVSQYFNQEELAVIVGGREIFESFLSLPFDHLLFSGTAAEGKNVMRRASENLTPVTLELGGKSPLIVGRDAQLKKVAAAVVAAKCLAAGQLPMSPDYLFVKENALNELIAEIERAALEQFRAMLGNPAYASVINEEQYHRLISYIEDAKQKGGEIWEINPSRENFRHLKSGYKIPLTLIINPTEDMVVMQEAIRGPLLPIKSYHHIDEVTEYINSAPKPLRLYYFGGNKTEMEKILTNTVSGGATVNGVFQDVCCEELPYGGVGASGMGSYHGIDGFRTFSHAKSVYKNRL